MKTEEDEAFDEIARKQGMWGGGFQAKRAAAADKMHWSDCAVHNGPAYPAGPCDCGPTQPADNPYGYDWSMLEAAQESLREHMARIKELEAQLSQPAQGHVAVVEFEPVIQGHEVWFPARCIASEIPTGTKLYTKPPKREWVGLTDEEIDALWQEWKDAVCLDHKTWAKAIESALKDKNNGT